MKEKSTFEVLSNVNVNEFIKGKNGYKFLSWSHAVSNLLKLYPEAHWEFREWDGVPYLKTESGCFVEASVTINNVIRKQLHPILDYKNKPILKPTAFEVNTSMQRALTKAMSLHGLGLYIYAGEDIPMSETEALADARDTLTDLLKKNNKYNQQAHIALMKMNYDQLQEKINEYKGE